MNIILKRIISSLLVITLIFTSLGQNVMATPLKLNTNEALDNYKVEFYVVDDWGAGFNGRFKITNTGQEEIKNWQLSFEFPYDINSFWTAQIIKHTEDNYEIKGYDWNNTIPVGQSIELGFGGLPGNVAVEPSQYNLKYTNDENDQEENGTDSEESDTYQEGHQSDDITIGEYTYGFNVLNDWGTGYHGEIYITNNSEEKIESWALAFDFDGEINNCWAGEVVKKSDGHYIIKSLDWNTDIMPGDTVKIGFSGTPGNITGYPKNYQLVNQIAPTDEARYDIDFTVTNDWSHAFNAQIEITNKGITPIEDWVLVFDFDNQIDRFWTAKILEHQGTNYKIKNADYNANIAPGQTMILGFTGSPGDLNDIQPINFQLFSNTLGEEYIGSDGDNNDWDNDGIDNDTEIELGMDPNSFDSNDNGIPDGYELNILISSGIGKVDIENYCL